jgi:hypothetical protein
MQHGLGIVRLSQQEQRVLSVHPLRRAVVGLLPHCLLPPHIPAATVFRLEHELPDTSCAASTAALQHGSTAQTHRPATQDVLLAGKAVFSNTRHDLTCSDACQQLDISANHLQSRFNHAGCWFQRPSNHALQSCAHDRAYLMASLLCEDQSIVHNLLQSHSLCATPHTRRCDDHFGPAQPWQDALSYTRSLCI